MGKILAALTVIVLLFNACKHPPKEPVAGKGGNASLKVITRHHTKLIPNTVVYLGYNKSSKPAVFNDSAQVMNYAGDTIAIFGDLKPGQYFVYGKGYDDGEGKIVDGGIPFKIEDEKEYRILCPINNH